MGWHYVLKYTYRLLVASIVDSGFVFKPQGFLECWRFMVYGLFYTRFMRWVPYMPCYLISVMLFLVDICALVKEDRDFRLRNI